jgi:hypothetical protein
MGAHARMKAGLFALLATSASALRVQRSPLPRETARAAVPALGRAVVVRTASAAAVSLLAQVRMRPLTVYLPPLP